ncbi:MAG: protein-L-isoaspartate O-methyltransferase, partial [Gammaproteobacteria bacterium]
MNALNIKLARYNMIEQQIRPWDVLDERVLDLLADLPREDFVPEKYQSLAFSDMSIPLERGQFMMPPKLEARILQSLEINATDRILEIGTGSGYLTACLAKLGRSVESVDIFEHFTTSTQEKLNSQAINNVSLQTADAANGWGEGEYDVIVMTGSLPVLHREFHEKLSIGG